MATSAAKDTATSRSTPASLAGPKPKQKARTAAKAKSGASAKSLASKAPAARRRAKATAPPPGEAVGVTQPVPVEPGTANSPARDSPGPEVAGHARSPDEADGVAPPAVAEPEAASDSAGNCPGLGPGASDVSPAPPPAPETTGQALEEAVVPPWVQPITPPDFVPVAPARAWRPRHVVFIDVENTSSESSINRVLDTLDLEGLGTSTEVIAIGNWRVIGQGLARSLAARGAQLVHSAPATRVRDWSDLWIAVQAGIWLGRARAGDRIELVSHDRAFDAIGDAASRLGVYFRRVTYGDGTRAQPAEAAPPAARTESGGRRRGGRGRGRGSRRSTASPAQEGVADSVRDVAGAGARSDVPQPAPLDEIQVAIARLTAREPAAGVTLDALAEALKSAGFHRPPGSPRLVTRLKRLKDVEVMDNGLIRLVSAHAATATPEPDAGNGEAGVADARNDEQEGAQPAEAPARRSRRRGGRRRGGRSRHGQADEPSDARDDSHDAPPQEAGHD